MVEYLPAVYDRICMHEFVVSGASMKREPQIETLEPAPVRQPDEASAAGHPIVREAMP